MRINSEEHIGLTVPRNLRIAIDKAASAEDVSRSCWIRRTLKEKLANIYAKEREQAIEAGQLADEVLGGCR